MTLPVPVAVTRVVLDASVTAAWLLPDERTPAAERAYARLRRGDLVCHAPELWLTECGNLVANAVRRSRMSAEDAMLTWSMLDAIRSRVQLTSPAPAQLRAALALALDHGLSLYDATYLWLGLSLGLPLLSHDRRLSTAASEAGALPTLTLEALA